MLLHDLVCCNGKCRCWFADARTGLQVSAAWWCGNEYCRSSSSLAGCCIAVSWYLQRGIARRPEVILRRPSEIALKRAGYDFRKLALKKPFERVSVIGWKLASASVCSCDWLDPTSAAGCWESHKSLASGHVCLLSGCLVDGCCVYKRVKGYVFYSLSEGNCNRWLRVCVCVCVCVRKCEIYQSIHFQSGLY